MEELLNSYKEKKSEINSKIDSFKALSKKEQFKEFLFCLLTPQSNALRCWQAVEEISLLRNKNYDNIFNILKTKTRFHKTKTLRILQAKKSWGIIKPILNNRSKDIKELRNMIASTINGYGLKESSHFLRNIGLSNNQIAILDRHILKNLYALSLIKDLKIKNRKSYLEIESIFIDFANKVNIPPDHLDLLWWSNENGRIFK